MALTRAKMTFPPSQEFLYPALEFVHTFVKQTHLPQSRAEGLQKALEVSLATVMRNNVSDTVGGEPIGLEVFKNEYHLVVEVINRGVPILWNDPKEPTAAKLKEVSSHLEGLFIQNRGREGQTITLRMNLENKKDQSGQQKNGDETALSKVKESEIEIRLMKPEEAGSLSQLFYHVYGYQYINEAVYYPEKIAQMISQGELISFVASLPDNRLLGHVGLVRCNDQPLVYEPCLGVTDPRAKSRGLFSKLFQGVMDRLEKIPLQYCLIDFVTNHDYTQRFVSRYGTADLALFVGCQSKETQAKLEKIGMGADPQEMDRYSLLVSVLPRVPQPFGKIIQLPNNLGELLGFLLEPLGMSWIPTSRFQVLPAEGEYETVIQKAQSAIVFDLKTTGRSAVEKIIKEWASYLREGLQYGAVDVPVDQPGLAQIYDQLSSVGFFIAGFVPYRASDKLAVRFQSIGPTKVAFDGIRVSTEQAKKLLAIVRQSYERNVLL